MSWSNLPETKYTTLLKTDGGRIDCSNFKSVDECIAYEKYLEEHFKKFTDEILPLNAIDFKRKS